MEHGMLTTQVFRNGNSQAIRIPAEIAYERNDIELEVERIGDEIRIRPRRKKLTGLLTKFSQFSPSFMEQGCETLENQEREPLR
jgi:antitoxin VapB